MTAGILDTVRGQIARVRAGAASPEAVIDPDDPLSALTDDAPHGEGKTGEGKTGDQAPFDLKLTDAAGTRSEHTVPPGRYTIGAAPEADIILLDGPDGLWLTLDLERGGLFARARVLARIPGVQVGSALLDEGEQLRKAIPLTITVDDCRLEIGDSNSTSGRVLGGLRHAATQGLALGAGAGAAGAAGMSAALKRGAQGADGAGNGRLDAAPAAPGHADAPSEFDDHVDDQLATLPSSAGSTAGITTDKTVRAGASPGTATASRARRTLTSDRDTDAAQAQTGKRSGSLFWPLLFLLLALALLILAFFLPQALLDSFGSSASNEDGAIQVVANGTASANGSGSLNRPDISGAIQALNAGLMEIDLAYVVSASDTGSRIRLTGWLSYQQASRLRGLLLRLGIPDSMLESAIQPIPSEAPPMPMIAGVALEPETYAVGLRGERYKMGDTLPNGWRLSLIDENGAILSQDLFAIRVGF